MIAGIETGGTKVICAVVAEDQPRSLLRSTRIATTTPDETMSAVNAFLAEVSTSEPITALGVASFGPVNVTPGGERYGWIAGTPKKGWANIDLLARIDLAGRVPTALLADVGSAALGEQTWGAGRGSKRLAYATFGTGVGVGLVLDGNVLHGNCYPELGHILVRRHRSDTYPGNCPFHGDCLEGLASGPAVLGRWGCDTSALEDRERASAFEILGFYIAQLAAVTGYAVGVERFIVGGGIMKAPGLFDVARAQLPIVTGGPGASHAESLDQQEFMGVPQLGEYSGVLGAVAAAVRLA